MRPPHSAGGVESSGSVAAAVAASTFKEADEADTTDCP